MDGIALDPVARFADAFRAIMLAFIVATVLVPLLRSTAAPPASGNAR